MKAFFATIEDHIKNENGMQAALVLTAREGSTAHDKSVSPTRKGQAALDMVHQVAETISAMENQIEGRLVQSLEKIKVAEDLSRALEARAVQAESRALEAEKWLRRVHNAMQDKITARLRAQAQDV